MRVCVFIGSRDVLLRYDDDLRSYVIPTADELRGLSVEPPTDPWRFGTLTGEPVTGIVLEAGARPDPSPEDTNLVIVERRRAAAGMGLDEFWELNRAYHYAEWDRRSRFCGVCGVRTRRTDGELSKTCPSCAEIVYPVIAPAVIMAVIKDGKLLLARNRRHPAGMHSVLAGFVEPAETLEHAVRREVFEEASIQVRDVEYFGSQPWPFPNSLMIAFTARYASGRIKADDDEIETLGWFGPSELPEMLPGRYSVARRLIEWFVREQT